jgi:uncharacterized protein (TIGR03086 family)
MGHVDFRPTTTTLAALVRGVRDDQLTGATPCPAYSVADLLDHIGGLAVAFRVAATKESSEGQAPSADGSRLEEGWRDRIAGAVDELGEAWQDPAADDGFTMAGPVELPADQAALVALDEVTVHAWDLAAATGQPYDAADDGGLFGPPVPVADDAPALHHLLGATGRDPAWTP